MIGVRAAGAVLGAGVVALAPGADEAAGPPGVVAADRSYPTTRPAIASADVRRPIVETAVLEPSAGSWPEGMVRLFACRVETTCWVERPDAASLAGSNVTNRRSSRPPVRSARATPSMALISGRISVRAIAANPPRPSIVVAAIDAMTIGEALMLSAWTVGSTLAGRFALAIASLIAAVVSLTFVP